MTGSRKRRVKFKYLLVRFQRTGSGTTPRTCRSRSCWSRPLCGICSTGSAVSRQWLVRVDFGLRDHPDHSFSDLSRYQLRVKRRPGPERQAKEPDYPPVRLCSLLSTQPSWPACWRPPHGWGSYLCYLRVAWCSCLFCFWEWFISLLKSD